MSNPSDSIRTILDIAKTLHEVSLNGTHHLWIGLEVGKYIFYIAMLILCFLFLCFTINKFGKCVAYFIDRNNKKEEKEKQKEIQEYRIKAQSQMDKDRRSHEILLKSFEKLGADDFEKIKEIVEIHDSKFMDLENRIQALEKTIIKS